jgi:long-chain acyl-CoA synthetase
MTALPTVSPDIFVGVPRFYEKLHQGICDRIAAEPRLRRGVIRLAWSVGRRYSRHRLENRPVPLWLGCVHRIVDRTILVRVRRIMGERLRFMITGSAPTPKRLLEEFHALGWVVLEAYGLSENVLPMAMNRPDDFRFGTVGQPLPGNEIVVGHDGTIRVRGPGVFTGYLGNAEASPCDSEGFYATGDCGRWDRDGHLLLTGRTSDVIKTSTGRRIAPAAVEASLRSVPGVDQAVLIGAGRKCLVALCSLQSTSDEMGRESLRAALTEQLALINEPERPRAIGIVERPLSIELGELTANLKIKRGAIEKAHGELIQELYESLDAPKHSTEATIVFEEQCESRTP